MIRAKFLCISVTKSKHWDNTGRFLHTAKFQPVQSGSEENKKFFEATPSGHLEIGTFVENHFEPGQAYYLDFIYAAP